MKIYFCANGKSVHALIFGNVSQIWRREVLHGHTKESGHKILKKIKVEHFATQLQEYIDTSLARQGTPEVLLQNVLQLGFEAGEEGYTDGLLLSDLFEAARPTPNSDSQTITSSSDLLDTESRCEEDIPLKILLHLYEIGAKVGQEAAAKALKML